ncbi:heterokaryon incompatibility protein-domain-containing protein [Truncatella angustata]|uniref:Heterokaryon incompatibility protein-domain-containing protein n=1 Tax=Truncatella angustata TaxID=152316 RepID=A0A9P8UHW9_9PEZI|nr:heterokaryon incompatibility protein-domain-containing protein [Truncatella angustata]KAH6652497.1 heterokaryon incompatibility protein-domain-containing protein [Truncatella angustata]
MELMELDPANTTTLYKSLNAGEIRLARLEPGAARTPITISLILVNIESCPVYDALSYVWGDVRKVAPICCDGLSTDVTLNLHQALARVRLPHHSRLIWADALCINQGDPQERNRQVGLMAKIYSHARFVLACFGEAPDGRAEEVASLLNEYGPLLSQSHVADVLLPRPGEDLRRWIALSFVMTSSWFERAWVLQEVGLAKDPRVLYGPEEFRYRDLMVTVAWVRTGATELAFHIGLGAYLIHTNWIDWSHKWLENSLHRDYKLVDLLDHGALLDCQDPRDRIFAFLSHPLAKNIERLAPDYTKSKLEIYQETTVFLLKDAGVRVFSSVEHTVQTLCDGYPSWVIRWDTSLSMNNIYAHPATDFRAHGETTSSALVESNILHVKGIVVDSVETVFEMGVSSNSTNVFFREMPSGTYYYLADLVRKLQCSQQYAYSYPLVTTLARILCCDRGSLDSESPWNKWASQYQSQQSLQSSSHWSEPFYHWIRKRGNFQGRALVITKKGFYGLGPQVTKRGDLCCVVYGSAVPFVLRPVEATTGQMIVQLLGEVYVDGIMNGEAVTMRNEGTLREQVFAVV